MTNKPMLPWPALILSTIREISCNVLSALLGNLGCVTAGIGNTFYAGHRCIDSRGSTGSSLDRLGGNGVVDLAVFVTMFDEKRTGFPPSVFEF